MKIASPNIDSSNQRANEEALFTCSTALEEKDREDYAGAEKTMRPLWPGVGANPNPAGLNSSVTAEVFCA